MKNVYYLFVAFLLAFSLNATGQTQNALEFDGIDDYVDCGNDASLDITGPITIEAWIYTETVLQEYVRFVEKDWATSYFLGSSYGNDGIAFGMDPNGSVANVLETADDLIYQFIWTHVAGTWDGTTLKIYINGDLVASKPWSNTPGGSSENTLIGKYYVDLTHNFDGYMDEVRIWNVARSQTEIQANIYKEIENPASESNLVAYYQFDEGSATQTSDDLSQNDNTAVLGGTLAIESSDPTWITSTAPMPYLSFQDGIWEDVDTWTYGQGWPFKSWALVKIQNNVTVTTDDVAGTLTLLPVGRLTIDPTFSLDVADNFIIKSNATGTGSLINNGTFTYGSASVERYYTGGQWHLISSPISNAVSGMFTGLYLQKHNEATNMYTDIIPTNELLNPGQGYALWNNSTATASFNGTLTTGTVGSTNNIKRSGAGSANYGWNLVGNPYCSAIDWDAASGWTKTNVNNAVYIHRNATTWATYVGGVGTNGGSRYIANGQGFFVSVTDNAGSYPEYGTLTMTEAVKVHNNPTFYKETVANLLRLEIAGNGYTDETVIRFSEEATVNFDGNFDAHKIFGYVDEAANIYSTTEGQQYSINALPASQSTSVGVYAGTASEYEISATEVNDLQTVLLEDLLTGTVTNLLEGSYVFTYDGSFNDRFIIHFSPMTGIEAPSKTKANIFAYQNNVICYLPEATYGKASVYQINGQLVKTFDVQSGKNAIQLNKAGTYIVKIITDDFAETQKITIR
ncbi:MAG: T9SS type A sorting domain-containing protein [Bacteroidales bacterium]|nr:T9SS type A sorting domain-containing protein [Bacteroidales bacterium]MCF8405160.1 T9SS type A sorting domain-containing protein [Bacteroidales bacterium]